MRHIDSEELHKLIYQKGKDKYKKPQKWHKISIIRKSDNPAYGLGIPKQTINTFNLFGVYYCMRIEDSGAKLIFESGCKVGGIENQSIVA